MLPSILGVFSFFALASTANECATGQSCDNQDDGDDAFTAAQLRTLSRHPRRRRVDEPRALGLLQLDGYYWPTQPGDLNDLRTFCTVAGVDDPDYKCINASPSGNDDEFSLKITTVQGGTWSKIQFGKPLGASLIESVEYLLQDDNVHALMGNAGWFTWYQYSVSEIMHDLVKNDTTGKLKRKPWLGGSPAMLAAVGTKIKGIGTLGEHYWDIDGWDILKTDNDRIVLLTSNKELEDLTCMEGFLESLGIPVKEECEDKKKKERCNLRQIRKLLRKYLHIKTEESNAWTKAFLVFLLQLSGLPREINARADPTTVTEFVKKVAKQIIVVPWQDTLGYGIAVTSPGAMFHNVPATIRGSSNAATQLLQKLWENARAGLNVTGIIMESTEMPAYSNWVRKITGLGVWDSTVVGRCLMYTWPDYDQTEAQLKGNGPTLFNTSSFRDCMMGWWQPGQWETRAGYQKNGEIKHYDSLNLTTEQLDKLTCTGGRPEAGKSIGRLMEEFDTGKYGPQKVAASCLSVSPCAGRTWSGINCPNASYGGIFGSYSGCFCGGNCPGGYYCGGDEPLEIEGLENVTGAKAYVYGVRGGDYYSPSPTTSPTPA